MGKRSRALAADDAEWDPRAKLSRQQNSTRDNSDSDSSKPASGRQRKGGRTRVSCDQCSKRRSRCSLVGPACDGCVERGNPEECSYQALIWIENEEDLPSRQLRHKLDQLEGILAMLAKANNTTSRKSSRSPEIAKSLPWPCPEIPTNSDPASRNALARSLFANGHLRDIDLPGTNSILLADELLRLENNFLLASSTKQAVSAAPLPTPHQAHLAICFYSSSVNPTFRLLYEPNFFRDCQAFWTSGEIPSPTWLALYLAVCSAGFQVIATDQEALSQSGLDEDFTRRLAEKCWKESRETLEDEGFPITPAIEMIQVALVLAFAALSNSSTSISRTVALLGGAASAARAASLYVDPSDLSKTITPLEAEMRRRMFWALYTCEAYAHRMLDLIIAREFSSLCSPDPSVRRPLFLSNDCYTPTGHLSPPGLAATNHGAASSTATPIFTVASLVAKISWLIASDRASPSGSTVASLLDEMASFDGAFRQSSIAETMFRAAFVRLFHTSRDLELAGQSNNTRAVAPRYLHALLQSVSLEPDMARESMPFCMTLVMSAAVRSCITPVEGEIEDLRQFAAFLNIPSRIKVYGLPAARCASMLNALIGDTRPSSSIASPSLGGSSLATPSDATLPSPAVNSTLDVLDSHAHFQDFLRVVPLEAQQSFENGSLQIDQTYSAPQPSTAPAPLRKLAPPSRPLLGLRTSLPLDGMKGTTPILPNWQDASETPSRYVGYSWNANLF